MRYFFFLGLTMACTSSEPAKEVVSGPPSEVDWGSWDLQTTFVSQSTSCQGMGANGQGIGDMFAEIEVGDPDDIDVLLGIRQLQGVREHNGFSADSFDLIPVENTEGQGIGVYLEANVIDKHTFTGQLSYEIVGEWASCTILIDVDASWLYYEPPPPCNS